MQLTEGKNVDEIEEIKKLLTESKTIAIAGLSDKPERDSYDVAMYLKNAGYAIIPVNPNIREWNGTKAYTSPLEIPDSIKVDVIDIFRRSEFVEEIVNDALKMKSRPKEIWLQLGIENERAAEKARNAGIIVIQDKCIKIEHVKLP